MALWGKLEGINRKGGEERRLPPCCNMGGAGKEPGCMIRHT